MPDNQRKQIMFSGVQPTGIPTLGNYIGAFKNWRRLQDEFDCLFSVVDMHAITVRQDPAVLRRKCRELLMLIIASGLDPEKNIIYYQSHVTAHAELAWVLNCFTYVGELGRMTQFKDKSQKHGDNINAGLMTYPVLQAADILLYQADLVPVGEDQRQHLEISRDIAIRFNNVYGEVFTVPECYITKIGAKIMSLQEPDKKMSKSEDVNMNNVISMLDKPDVIVSKIKRAVTDSENQIIYSDSKPGVKNLLDIYCCMTGKLPADAEREFEGVGYGRFKEAVAQSILDELASVWKKFDELEKNKDYVDARIKENAERAAAIANRTLKKVYKKIGFPV